MNAEQRIKELESENAQLRKQLAEALARIEELEGQKRKSSHNSHKPPSSEGLGRQTHSLREPTGKKSGGQPHHRGQTLEMTATPDRVRSHRPVQCGQCGGSLEEVEGRVVERRQVYDLPPIRLRVEEHQVQEICCPHCASLNRGSFPEMVTAPVQYGAGVRAWAVYLNQYHLVPMERTCEILSEGLGCHISEGTLCNWVELASQGLLGTCEQIKRYLLASRLLHEDETGVHKGKKVHWFHGSSTRHLTYLHWHQKRGREAMDEIGILPNYHGRIMRDRWSSYDHYGCLHSVCGAHLLRDLTGVYERSKQQWAAHMKRVLIAMNKVAWYWRNLGAKAVPKSIRDRWVARYFDVLSTGFAAQPPPPPVADGLKKRGPRAQSEAKNLLDALLHRADQVLAFLDDLSIPFTNNQAERDLRMVKVQQKIAGTFRADSGMTAFCRIRSYLSTMHKQARPLLSALAAVFQGHPFPIALSLG